MESKKMPHVARDIAQYIMIPRIRYAREIGTYASYDIAAYNSFARDIVSIIPDVSSNAPDSSRPLMSMIRSRALTIASTEIKTPFAKLSWSKAAR